MRASLPSQATAPGMVRGLAWSHLEQGLRPRVGDAAWEALLRDAAGPARPDALGAHPRAAFVALLDLLDRRHGRGDGAMLAEAGRLAAAAWARQYRSLALRLRGDPGAMLEVFAGEVLPWLLDDPRAARVVDAGPASAVLEARGLPRAYLAGLLEGVALAAGAPRAEVAAHGERFAVTWEAPAPAASLAARVAALVRPPYVAAATVPVLLGAALAWHDGAFDAAYLAATLAGVLCFALGATAANDYFDHRSRADERNLTPTPFSGGSRAIQRGLLRPRHVLGLAALLFAAGSAIGLAIASQLQATRGAGLAEVLGLGVAGFLLGLLYTAPPVRLAHRGLGELAVGLGFGPLLVAGTYLVQSAAAGAGAVVSPAALAFSVPLGALVAAMLLINEVPDRPWDAAAGKRTLAVRLSAGRAAWGYGALLALAYGSIVAAAALAPAWPALLALLPAPLAVRAWRHLALHHEAPYKLVPANATTVLLHLATGLLLVGGVVLARLAPGV